MVTTYNVISADGFITRKDGSEGFIPDEVWDDFIDICKEHDAVIMGRKTYEAIQKYNINLLSRLESLEIKKIVVSSTQGIQLKPGYIHASDPNSAVKLAHNPLVTSGPSLNTSLLKEGLIDEVILNTLTDVKIGDGIKAFPGKLPVGSPSGTKYKGNRKIETFRIIK